MSRPRMFSMGITYQEYLESPEWAEKRRAVLARAAGRCEACGVEGVPLEVHHRTYERLGDEDVDSDLRALCRACHESAHGLREGRTFRAVELLPAVLARIPVSDGEEGQKDA